MRGLLITSFSIFSIAFIFRLLHWPGSALLAIFSVFLIYIFSVINSFRKQKVWNIDVFGGWLISFWASYILSKYMYWYSGPSILGFNAMFLVVFGLTIIYLMLYNFGKIKTVSKTMLIISIVGTIFSFIPSYSVCYFFDLNEVINKEHNETNYFSWDKYSWFLYIRGEKEQALNANKNAIKALLSYEKMFGGDISIPLEILNRHQQEINDGTWTESYLKPYVN